MGYGRCWSLEFMHIGFRMVPGIHALNAAGEQKDVASCLWLIRALQLLLELYCLGVQLTRHDGFVSCC